MKGIVSLCISVDGVFATSLVAEVAQNGGQVGLVAAQQFHYILNAQLIEVYAAFAPAHLEEGLQHFFEERIGDGHHVGDVIGFDECAVAAFAGVGARDGGGEQAVGDGLGVGVGKTFRREVVDQ